MMEWLHFVGKLHPVIIHLPIGIFLFTYWLVLLSIKNPSKYTHTIGWGLQSSFYTAIVASILGYLRYLTGDYTAEVLNHMWMAITTTVFIGLLWFLYFKKVSNRLFNGSFTLVVICLTISSHLGAQLTHGKGYLKLPKKPTTVSIKKDSINLYTQVIHSILDKKCVSCHGNEKQEGGLILSSVEGILKGGESGLAIDFKNPNDSRLLYHLELPMDHDLRMPPKSRTQLTPIELELIKNWVLVGAKFEQTMAYQQIDRSQLELLEEFFPPELNPVSPPSHKDLEKILAHDFRVDQYSMDHHYVVVRYLGDSLSMDAFDALYKIRKNVIELNLNSVIIPPSAFEKFRNFKNLKKLHLNHTNIEDQDLASLDALPLQLVSLTNTRITQEGIHQLLKNQSLEKLFLWKTSITDEEKPNIQNNSVIDIDFGVVADFAEKQQVERPQMVNQQTLFVDSLAVSFLRPIESVDIKYTLHGQTPDSLSASYQDSLWIKESGTLKAKSFIPGWLPSQTTEIDFRKVAHTITQYQLQSSPSGTYTNHSNLFDLELGSTSFTDGYWVGHHGDDLIVVFDAPEYPQFSYVSVSSMRSYGGWIMLPKSIKVYGLSRDGWQLLSELEIPQASEKFSQTQKEQFDIPIKPQDVEQYRIVVENLGVLPPWHDHAGESSWVFVDEIYLW